MKAMKQITIILSFLAVVGVLTFGCTGLDIVPLDRHSGLDPESLGIVTLTTTIGIEASPATKALDADGKKTFTAGEKVALIYTKSDGSTKAISEYTIQSEDISNGGKNAKLSFSLDDPKTGNVTLVYPASLASTTAADGIDLAQLQNNQDGTLATLSASFDAATATSNMTISGETASLPVSIALSNPLTIGEFTITDKDESSANVTSTITQLTVNDGTTTYTVNRAAAAGPIYVAMLPVTSDKTITLTAASSDHHYLKTVTGKALAANNLYFISVDMPQDMLYEPLTIVTTVDNTQICVLNKAATVIKYTINGGTVQTINNLSNIVRIDVNANSIVRFYGDNAKYSQGQNSYSNIYVNKDCYIYGNIMSLINSTSFPTATTLTADEAFMGLFKVTQQYRGKLKNHPSKALLLPATTLTNGCYHGMFSGCAGLTTAPALPATTLTEACYYEMFNDCTGLTTAPALPAMTLTKECYNSMFFGCTSLATAPVLPAETLAESCYMYMFFRCTGLTTAPALPAGTMKKQCYRQMFEGCTNLSAAPALSANTLAEGCYRGMFNGCVNLTTAPALPATILADYCYCNMFQGCTSLTTAPALPATTLAPRCYNEMFKGCTSLTTAPVLPAPTLATSCYRQMFQGCTKLSSITCLATEISAENCTTNWLDNAGTDSGVTSRQFITPSSTAWASPSVSGIPSGWTRVNTTSVNLSSINADYVAQNGDILTGTLASNYQLIVPAGATVMLAGMTHHAGQYVNGIYCEGPARINLVEGTTNDLTHGHEDALNGICVNTGTLTIDGTGTLVASGGNNHAGIGCGNCVCNISSCGDITFNGGTVVVNTDQEGSWGVGIDYTGGNYSCGDIKFVRGNVTVNGNIATKSLKNIYINGEPQKFKWINASSDNPFVYPIQVTS